MPLIAPVKPIAYQKDNAERVLELLHAHTVTMDEQEMKWLDAHGIPATRGIVVRPLTCELAYLAGMNRRHQTDRLQASCPYRCGASDLAN
jgi:hypothetical protein